MSYFCKNILIFLRFGDPKLHDLANL